MVVTVVVVKMTDMTMAMGINVPLGMSMTVSMTLQVRSDSRGSFFGGVGVPAELPERIFNRL